MIANAKRIKIQPLAYGEVTWVHWENAAIHGGPRIMHEKFCIVSDRPEVLTVDDQNRPHGEDGPFCRWRDGTALYSWHGVRVPAWVIERPQDITIDRIFAESNAEVRRVMIERFGLERVVDSDRVRSIDYNERHKAGLYSIDLGDGATWGLLAVTCHTTGKTTALWANPNHPSALAALAASYPKRGGQEYAPEVET